MRKIVSFLVFGLIILISSTSFAQKARKLSKTDEALMTSDQKLVYETNRKSKNGTKRVSVKKKVKIQEKQARRARSVKQPKPMKKKRPI